MEEFSETTEPGAFITSRFPWLSYLPKRLQWWRPQALKYYERQYDLWMKFLTELKSKVSAGKAPVCFAKDFLVEGTLAQELDDEQIAFLAGSRCSISQSHFGYKQVNLFVTQR